MKNSRSVFAGAALVSALSSGLAAAAGDSIHAYSPDSGYLIAGDQANCNLNGRYAAASWTATAGAEPAMQVNASSCGVGYHVLAQVDCQFGSASQPADRPDGDPITVTAVCGSDLGPASHWYGELITY